ncbi:MAG: sialate O-acetylesterase [Planctomycetota bacterium]
MRFTSILFLLGLFMTATTYGDAQNPSFHIYLCFGQSNMVGQGEIEESDRAGNERFMVLQSLDCAGLDTPKGEWRVAVPPLCHCGSGLSLVDTFGKAMADHLPDDIRIGVIHVGVSGCDIRLFDKDIYLDYHKTHDGEWFARMIDGYGGNPYQHLIDLAQQAQKDGVIKGILLHQGETNTNDVQWLNYVKKIYTDMLEDLSLNAKEVPLLAGELVHEDQNGKCANMNVIINKLPETIPTAHVISSSGCTAVEDDVHFDAAGYRELGRRYAAKMFSLLGDRATGE